MQNLIEQNIGKLITKIPNNDYHGSMVQNNA